MALKSIVGPVIWGGTPAIIAWMRSRHVLASSATCMCGNAMRERERNDISDGIVLHVKDQNQGCSQDFREGGRLISQSG